MSGNHCTSVELREAVWSSACAPAVQLGRNTCGRVSVCWPPGSLVECAHCMWRSSAEWL